MSQLASVPEWLGTAVIGAIIAALGYVAKLAADLVRQWRKNKAIEAARLLQMASLLQASREVFISQRKLIGRLQEALDARLPTRPAPGIGYERQFTEVFAIFTPEERELHRLIRSITEHGLRPLNLAMSDWLSTDITYRNSREVGTARGRLAWKLNRLDTHLRLWHAKYAAWIPEYPEHALVYLADEEDHGLGFPVGLDATVKEVLGSMGGSSPSEKANAHGT